MDGFFANLTPEAVERMRERAASDWAARLGRMSVAEAQATLRSLATENPAFARMIEERLNDNHDKEDPCD